MSNESKVTINWTLFVFALGGFTSALLAYGDLRHQVISGNEQNKELREIIRPLVEKVNNLERDVDRLKVEIDRFPKVSKATVDNLPLWKYDKN